MGPVAATKSVFRNYTSMSGRASRSEYWWWGLVQLIVVSALLAILLATPDINAPGAGASIAGMALAVFTLATIVPNITVMVRRLHDTGRSGFWYFISFVPVIGGIWFLVLMLLGSEQGTNRFGPPPHSGDDADPAPNPRIRVRKPSDSIYDRTDVSNAYVAAYTTDPRRTAMLKAEAENAHADFAAHRKAEISEYYKNKVLKGTASASQDHH